MVKQIMVLTLVLGLSLGGALSVEAAPAVASATQQSAQDFMQMVTDQLLKKLVDQRTEYKKDPQLLYRIVDESITPYVDYATIARRVMGQYFRQTNDAQHQRFAATFKDSLIRTYGNGLAAYDHQTITILPSRIPVTGDSATVQMEIVNPSGQSIPVTYELKRNVSGQWMLENVVLNGINLGLTFRNQFASDVEQYHNDFNMVISHWVPEAPKVHQP
ncbi:MAG: ABC transporter substrate-binding protein [Pseudomonadales bacterium]|nr:ABC transporter substrate-binding protein [Pseudomonadales bacterium]